MIGRLENQQLAPANVGDDLPFQPQPQPFPVNPVMPPVNVAPSEHRVQAGDYLWKIAKEQLGDANRWPEIYALNKDAIGDNPNLLQPGQLLKLPGGQRPAPLPANNNQLPPMPVNPIMPVPNQQQPPFNQQQPLPPLVPNQQQPLPPLVPNQPLPPLPNQQPLQGVSDVPLARGNRPLNDQQIMEYGRMFNLLPPNAMLTPELRANVQAFADELDSYTKQYRGQVFGPGMDNMDPRMGEVVSQQEAQNIRQSVAELRQALGLLIKSGALQVSLPNGQPVRDLAVNGSYFQLDAQGRELRDAQGNPLMDEAFVAAITQFKLKQGIHQNYKLADGTFAVNEFVGPATVEALKRELTRLQQPRI
jgi:LysM repeat protein